MDASSSSEAASEMQPQATASRIPRRTALMSETESVSASESVSVSDLNLFGLVPFPIAYIINGVSARA